MAVFTGRTWTLLTVVLTVQLSAVCGKVESQNAQKQSLLIEETVEAALEQLLNIHPSKWKPKTVSSEGKSDESLMPSYMKDLYQKYSKGYVPKSSKRHTNTIRSILPVKGNIQGEEMLLFNLTAVSSWQDIVYTEVHFFQRRYQSPERKRYKLIPLPQEYRLEVFDIHGLAVTSLGKWKLGKRRRGWQVQDLTGPVQKIRQHAEPPHLLGFKIQIAQVGNKHQKYHSVPLKSVLRMDPSPFLIIFSNESNRNGTPSWPVESALEPIPVSVAGKGDSILQYIHAESTKPKPNKKRTQRSLQDNRIEEIDYSNIPRTARSIHDNELPDLDGFSNYIPQSHPNMLQIRAPKLKKPVSKPKIKTTTTTPKPKTIPYPKGFSAASYAQKWVSDKKRKARKNKRKHRKLPDAWHYTQQSYGNEARHEAPEDYGNSLCQRRKFVVDFAEIGWSEWIISPKSFEAHYCTGKCPFPLNKALNPSNHATIQSIVHAIGLHPEVPAPCCVPDVMSSVTLLYFDDDRNVVLKNYPSMTAETCACR